MGNSSSNDNLREFDQQFRRRELLNNRLKHSLYYCNNPYLFDMILNQYATDRKMELLPQRRFFPFTKSFVDIHITVIIIFIFFKFIDSFFQ